MYTMQTFRRFCFTTLLHHFFKVKYRFVLLACFCYFVTPTISLACIITLCFSLRDSILLHVFIINACTDFELYINILKIYENFCLHFFFNDLINNSQKLTNKPGQLPNYSLHIRQSLYEIMVWLLK